MLAPLESSLDYLLSVDVSVVVVVAGVNNLIRFHCL